MINDSMKTNKIIGMIQPKTSENSGEGSIFAITSSPVFSLTTAKNLFDIFLKVS